MAIEDVDYLKDNSTKQTYTFLVDSSDRDRSAYPDPNNYVVTFSQPFNSVISLEVLDASIPRTMYNIDYTTNTITFYIHDVSEELNADVTPAFVTAEVEPGDYTIHTLIDALNKVTKMQVNGNEIAITADHVSNPPELKNVILFHCSYPFVIDMSRSTIAESLGFDLYTIGTEVQKPITAEHTWRSRRYNTVPGWDQPGGGWLRQNRRMFHSVDAPVELAMGEATVVLNGPRSVNRKLPITASQQVAQKFAITSRGYVTKIEAAFTTVTGFIAADSQVRVSIYTDNSGLPGMVMCSEIVATIAYTDGGYTTMVIPPVYVTEGKYWAVFSGFNDTTYIYYNDIAWANEQTLKTWSGSSWGDVDTDTIHFVASIRVTKQDPYHYLVAPGVYSLVGERYVILRCPEIEEHSYRSLAYSKHNLGLAKFRLGVVGYSENRVDFNKVKLREFHPIGRLSRLTLRFETSTGKPYDFKGVNHSITFAIHYLEAAQKEKFVQSVLNPNYRGNYLSYTFDDDQREDSQDEYEHDYNGDEVTEPDYRAYEARYLPDTVRRLDLQARYQIQDDDDD